MTKTFLKITNKDIYEEIKSIGDKLEDLNKKNAKEHGSMVNHQLNTNGKVKMNRWIATSAWAGLVALSGILISSAITTLFKMMLPLIKQLF